MAHPVSINLFDVLSLANSLSGGTLLGTGLLIGAVGFFAFAAALHERKTRKAERRARNVVARAEQERLAGATVRELHLDEREGRDIHPPIRLERVLRDALHADVHNVFPEENE